MEYNVFFYYLYTVFRIILYRIRPTINEATEGMILVLLLFPEATGQGVKFPDTADIYAVQISGEESYTLFLRNTNTNYSSKDGRKLYQSQQDKYWKICTMKQNHCHDIYFQPGSKPSGRNHWKKITSNLPILIEVQGLENCVSSRGFSIEPRSTTQSFSGVSLDDCRARIYNLVSFVSFSRELCSASSGVDTKLVLDHDATLFISSNCQKEQLDNSGSGIDANITEIDTTTVQNNETLKENEKLGDDLDMNAKILYVFIAVAVFLVILILAALSFICLRRKYGKPTTIVTENEAYGSFSDLDIDNEDRKKNMIMDGNDYYIK